VLVSSLQEPEKKRGGGERALLKMGEGGASRRIHGKKGILWGGNSETYGSSVGKGGSMTLSLGRKQKGSSGRRGVKLTGWARVSIEEPVYIPVKGSAEEVQRNLFGRLSWQKLLSCWGAAKGEKRRRSRSKKEKRGKNGAHPAVLRDGKKRDKYQHLGTRKRGEKGKVPSDCTAKRGGECPTLGRLPCSPLERKRSESSLYPCEGTSEGERGALFLGKRGGHKEEGEW